MNKIEKNLKLENENATYNYFWIAKSENQTRINT